MKRNLFVLFVVSIGMLFGACNRNGGGSNCGPLCPSPPTETLQLLDLKIGIADSTELGAPVTGPVAVGTKVRYTLIFGSPTGMSGLTKTFTTFCNGQAVNTDSFIGGAGAGSNNYSKSEYAPVIACNYTVQASITDAIPAVLEKTFEAK